jgi:hypothetical protein
MAGRPIQCRECGAFVRTAQRRCPACHAPLGGGGKGRPRRLALVLGLAAGGVLLLGGVLGYVLWDRGPSGTEPEELIVGKWVSPSEDWEFGRDGTFRRTSQALTLLGNIGTSTGTYKLTKGNRIELDDGQALCYPGEFYVAPAELRVFLWTARGARTQRQLESAGGLSMFFRRAGKEGPLRDGEGLGGSVAQTHKRLVGRWVAGNTSWEFTADGRLKRPFYAFPATYRVLDAKTVELTERAGKKVLELAPYRDTMRAWLYKAQDWKAGHPSVASFRLERAPADDHADEPVQGAPRDLILGRWEAGDDLTQPPAYTLTRDGGYVWEQEQFDQIVRVQGTYKLLGERAVLLYPGARPGDPLVFGAGAPDFPAETREFLKKLKEGVVVRPAEAYRVAFTRGKMILVQIDMRVVEPDFDPEASGAELGDIGIVLRRQAKGGQAPP